MVHARACRILTISSSIEHARLFIQRIKELSEDESDLPDEGLIPWTISNKYYTADVHFETIELHKWSSHNAQDVPAVIFLWAHGEPFRDHVPYIARELAHHEPEVSLAVKFGSSQVTEQTQEEGVDEFLADHGFEYVDGSQSISQGPVSNELIDDRHAVPGLPRVIDALSTIMWPSMVQSQGSGTLGLRSRELLDWARREDEEDGLRSFASSEDHTLEGGAVESKTRMRKEMEELENWLREDSDPWANVESPDALQPVIVTPDANTSWPPLDAVDDNNEAWRDQGRFDDDFTAFVSAPDYASGSSSPARLAFDEDRLAPTHTSPTYHSLGSMSDFGDDENNDTDLPTKEEIEATSRRIFGSIPLSPSHSGTPTGFSRLPSQSDVLPMDDTDLHASTSADDYDMAPFDLSQVMTTLQSMKAEIAGMDDEQERRRAAAKVALGLVYGLEGPSSNQSSGEKT
ncbi:hypothetical protein JAAARDRAFT_189809 [Jaapia argillacea MUCL 33604]|uniref:Uncharacterized protein n=1 Tax=Jaapia argillacea MUCL 33604 TaxID=933084 RepID=A0A067Q6B1_9AGAM|nr:hypothetical protein JAAARDRAFT_189809 [Jaapia argillacea MUCL 33604]